MQEQNFKKIFKEFSDARLETYKNFLGLQLSMKDYTFEQVYNLYAWNESISNVFWVVVSRIEIILRNHINHILIKSIGKDWLDVKQAQANRIFFTQAQEKQIDKANRKLSNIGKPITNDRLVAELNMGFWLSFYDIQFALKPSEAKNKQIGWKYFIPNMMTGFVDYPNQNQNIDKTRYWSRQNNIDKLISQLNIAKEIRNRIAHHEPVFNYTPTYLQDISEKENWNFLQNLQVVYFHLLSILHGLSPMQSMFYQKSYNHVYASHLISPTGFDEHLKTSHDDNIVDLEKFIDEMMNCMGNNDKKDSLGIRHISDDNRYFGCFIPHYIKN